MKKRKKQELGPLQREFVRCLRSGEFPQGIGHLFTVVADGEKCEHCCLGVACCVAHANGVRMIRWSEYQFGDKRILASNGFMTTMPGAVADALSFRNQTGEFDKKRHGVTSLIGLNDGRRYTFNEIADFIERYPHAVFTEPA
jgi:hypothetical protein